MTLENPEHRHNPLRARDRWYREAESEKREKNIANSSNDAVVSQMSYNEKGTVREAPFKLSNCLAF